MMTSNTPSLADIAAITNNDGFGGTNGLWFIIILALLFGWGNNSGFGGANGANANYVLGSDFSMLSRQISDGFGSQERKLDGIANGICSLGYDQLAQMNGINTNILTNSNALQTQIADGFCGTKSLISDLNYNLATQCCSMNNAIQNAKAEIIANDNNNYRALHDEIVSDKLEQKDAEIARQNQQINALQLAQSQQMQNAYLINQLRPMPIPSYPVANPYYYGTTIS